MRNIMIFAVILIILGTFMGQMADKVSSDAAQAKAFENAKSVNSFASVQPQTVGNAGGRSLVISRDGRGHFQTDGRIDGQRLGFMVDTGASVIALNERSAAQIGVRPSRNEYTTVVSTANGKIKAARTRLGDGRCRRAHCPRCRCHGAPRRSIVGEPAGSFVFVEAQAL